MPANISGYTVCRFFELLYICSPFRFLGIEEQAAVFVYDEIQPLLMQFLGSFEQHAQVHIIDFRFMHSIQKHYTRKPLDRNFSIVGQSTLRPAVECQNGIFPAYDYAHVCIYRIAGKLLREKTFTDW